MPLLSVIVPAYNAAAYLGRALDGLGAVRGIEVIVVDDGSTDGTREVAEAWAARSPESIRVVSQENRGHGGAINTGLASARGDYFKVLDADDWLDIRSLRLLVAHLDVLRETGTEVDAVFTDFVHERLGKSPKAARFDSVFPEGRVFEWSDTERFGRRQVLMMHAIVYRTQLLRDVGLSLPEHTFYVDNLFVRPFARLRRANYLPVPLYRYFISVRAVGRARVMVRRRPAAARVNRLALATSVHADLAAGGCRGSCIGRCSITSSVCAVTSDPRPRWDGRALAAAGSVLA
ncbi:glycosyltransferase family 2 protein [Microbacterium sp.]|uniref:glycosyltransferase family 2 protein n=1 Tax=Microbacterium sp. TaxID=51671 RepID=UPI003A8E62C3